jgi:hypothetical protein
MPTVRTRRACSAALSGLGFAAIVTLALLLAGVTSERAARAARSRPAAGLPRAQHVLEPAVDSPCDHPRRSPLAYSWPVKPFDVQHPIRGFFGDPRTVGRERLGSDRRGSPGSFTFHNGVDVYAPGGTPVYPVVSGVAHVKSGDRVSVTTGDGRTFQYVHITPVVQPGEPVVAYRTVLGTVKPVFHHVHLTELDHFTAHNPLDPGHLEPYRDHTVPEVDGLSFANGEGVALNPRRLFGRVQITAQAEDVTPLPVPGHWLGFPVTPALITWQLATAGGRVVLHAIAADFRHTEPLNLDFWSTYAAGTYQNFPDFTHHLYWRVPGRYLFDLTPTFLHTARLRNGVYRISVGAADTCGNRSILTEAIRIDNRRTPPGPVELKRASVE